MNWFTKLFRKKDDDRYRPRVRTLYDFLTRYQEAYHHYRCMRGFENDITRNNCSDIMKMPSKKVMRRYTISPEFCNGLAWYLLEKYSEGKLKIEE